MSIKTPYHLRPINELTNEDMMQIALIEWSQLPETLAKYPQLEWLLAVPNGGARSIKTGSLLKQTGVKKGVFDLLLLCPARDYHGLCIELKYKKGKPTAEQLKFKAHHEKIGYRCVVCWSWVDAKQEIINYLSDYFMCRNY